MASEMLAVPEEELKKMIVILRAGIAASKSTRGYGHICRRLESWCKEEEEYLKDLQTD